jgi:hypothetical protein
MIYRTWTEHLQHLVEQVDARLDAKYRAGQAEHGGSLWRKPNLTEQAIDEAVDQLTYLLTKRNQDVETLRSLKIGLGLLEACIRNQKWTEVKRAQKFILRAVNMGPRPKETKANGARARKKHC